MSIADLMLREQQYEFSPEAEVAFREYLDRRMRQPRFANARSVHNALERARPRQASRTVGEGRDDLGREDLIRIEAPDFLQNRVFEEEVHEA